MQFVFFFYQVNNPFNQTIFSKDSIPQKNPYRWLPRKENKKDGKKTKEKDNKPWPNSPSEEEHIKKVTQVRKK